MEIILTFASILIAVSLSSGNPVGMLFAFAACQFLATLAWFAVGAGR